MAFVEGATRYVQHLVGVAVDTGLIVRGVSEQWLECSSEPQDGMSSNYAFTLRPFSPPRLEIALVVDDPELPSSRKLLARACGHANKNCESAFVYLVGGSTVSAVMETPLKRVESLTAASLHKSLAELHRGVASFYGYLAEHETERTAAPALTVIEGGKGRHPE